MEVGQNGKNGELARRTVFMLPGWCKYLQIFSSSNIYYETNILSNKYSIFSLRVVHELRKHFLGSMHFLQTNKNENDPKIITLVDTYTVTTLEL